MKKELTKDETATFNSFGERKGFKFLIIRFSSIGDIVLTTPVVRCLKKQIPNAEIHYLTKAAFAAVVENNPYIDKIHLLAHSWELLVHELKTEQYDYIIDLHHNLRTLKLKRELQVKSFSFNKLNIRKWMLTSFKWNMMPELHVVDRYMKTVESFNVKNDRLGLDYFINENDEVKQNDIPFSHLSGFISIVIGAAHITKKLPVNKLKELCSQINHPIILLGGKEDAAAGKEISMVDSVKIYNACGKFKLNESADLVKKSKLIITHDTGLMHIAAAYKKPIISIWGNTVPAFGMYPYYGNTVIPNSQFQVSGLKCRPCSKIGYKKCPKGHFKCMNDININEIIKKGKEFL